MYLGVPLISAWHIYKQICIGLQPHLCGAIYISPSNWNSHKHWGHPAEILFWLYLSSVFMVAGLLLSVLYGWTVLKQIHDSCLKNKSWEGFPRLFSFISKELGSAQKPFLSHRTPLSRASSRRECFQFYLGMSGPCLPYWLFSLLISAKLFRKDLLFTMSNMWESPVQAQDNRKIPYNLNSLIVQS